MMLISAGSAASSRLAQTQFTSPVTLVRWRVYTRLRVLDCLLFRLELESLIIGVQTFIFIHI
jgi:hypothetical protein